MNKKKLKRKGRSVQDLLAIKTFTKNGLQVGKDELIFFSVQPINISVLSHENIEIKTQQCKDCKLQGNKFNSFLEIYKRSFNNRRFNN